MSGGPRIPLASARTAALGLLLRLAVGLQGALGLVLRAAGRLTARAARPAPDPSPAPPAPTDAPTDAVVDLDWVPTRDLFEALARRQTACVFVAARPVRQGARVPGDGDGPYSVILLSRRVEDAGEFLATALRMIRTQGVRDLREGDL